MNGRQTYILNLALALTFFAISATAFFFPEDISNVINNSLIFKGITGNIPVWPIGIHDAIIGMLLILRRFPKLIAIWATMWIGVVMILLVSSMNINGLLDALEHAAPLGLALYLSLSAFASQKDRKVT